MGFAYPSSLEVPPSALGWGFKTMTGNCRVSYLAFLLLEMLDAQEPRVSLEVTQTAGSV